MGLTGNFEENNTDFPEAAKAKVPTSVCWPSLSLSVPTFPPPRVTQSAVID